MISGRSFLLFLGVGATCLVHSSAGIGEPLGRIPGARSPVEAKYATKTFPFNVGSQAQLFIDQVLVHESERVAFTLHPAEKHPKNPLLKADRPWEGFETCLFGSVLFDEEEKVFKMWYWGGEETSAFPKGATMYATSKDGITWEKPLLGLK